MRISPLEDLLGSVLTVQQSRFQVGLSDVLSVVSVNLRDTRKAGHVTIRNKRRCSGERS